METVTGLNRYLLLTGIATAMLFLHGSIYNADNRIILRYEDSNTLKVANDSL